MCVRVCFVCLCFESMLISCARELENINIWLNINKLSLNANKSKLFFTALNKKLTSLY